MSRNLMDWAAGYSGGKNIQVLRVACEIFLLEFFQLSYTDLSACFGGSGLAGHFLIVKQLAFCLEFHHKNKRFRICFG
jgi:hypothetical protein